MARAPGRNRACSKATIAGRRAKADEFWASACEADVLHPHDHADSVIQMCVLAGIAAADVICCVRLGEHADGQAHNAAVALLAKVDQKLATSLGILLRQKTDSAYREKASSSAKRRAAKHAAEVLVEAARLAR